MLPNPLGILHSILWGFFSIPASTVSVSPLTLGFMTNIDVSNIASKVTLSIVKFQLADKSDPGTTYIVRLDVCVRAFVYLSIQLNIFCISALGMARKEEHLTPTQKSLAIRTMPSLLEYLSYNCNFMGILAGPLYTYKDYIAFIEGKTLHVKCAVVNGKRNDRCEHAEPSPVPAVLCKLLVCGISLTFHLTITKMFPVAYNIDETFVNTANFASRLFYLYFSLMAARPKYYFAWSLADAINNAAGFGFNGYDVNGNERWDLISNLNIVNIESATSFKMFIDNWNIQTALWFKRVCYDRCRYHPTIATFIISAIWHGVYPGYYMTFLTAIPITLAARAMRNNTRIYFIKMKGVKLFYDFITWSATMIAISYTVVPFVLLSVEPSLKFYRSWYYCLHIVPLLVMLVLPIKSRRKESEQNHSKLKRLEVENTSTSNNYAALNNNLDQISRPS